MAGRVVNVGSAPALIAKLYDMKEVGVVQALGDVVRTAISSAAVREACGGACTPVIHGVHVSERRNRALPLLSVIMQKGEPVPAMCRPVWRLVDLMADITRALAAMHARGLVHRDVKPHNVVSVDGRGALIDFDLATTLGQTASLISKTATLWYRAPEVSTNPRLGAEPASDMWSLGMTIAALFLPGDAFTGMAREAFAVSSPKHDSPALIAQRSTAFSSKVVLAVQHARRHYHAPGDTHVSKLVGVVQRCLKVKPGDRLGAMVASIQLGGVVPPLCPPAAVPPFRPIWTKESWHLTAAKVIAASGDAPLEAVASALYWCLVSRPSVPPACVLVMALLIPGTLRGETAAARILRSHVDKEATQAMTRSLAEHPFVGDASWSLASTLMRDVNLTTLVRRFIDIDPASVTPLSWPGHCVACRE